MNPRPHAPKARALPDCATPRKSPCHKRRIVFYTNPDRLSIAKNTKTKVSCIQYSGFLRIISRSPASGLSVRQKSVSAVVSILRSYGHTIARGAAPAAKRPACATPYCVLFFVQFHAHSPMTHQGECTPECQIMLYPTPKGTGGLAYGSACFLSSFCCWGSLPPETMDSLGMSRMKSTSCE